MYKILINLIQSTALYDPSPALKQQHDLSSPEAHAALRPAALTYHESIYGHHIWLATTLPFGRQPVLPMPSMPTRASTKLQNSNFAPTSKNRSSSTDMVAVGVATGEAMGDRTTRDDGETGKEPKDHSGDGVV
ncbi:hypothetical protein Tco_1225437 [Tanacetum coccineum]